MINLTNKIIVEISKIFFGPKKAYTFLDWIKKFKLINYSDIVERIIIEKIKNNEYQNYYDVFKYYSDEHIFEFFYEENELIHQECNVLLNFISNSYAKLNILYIYSKKNTFYIGKIDNFNDTTVIENVKKFCKNYKLIKPTFFEKN